VDAHAPYLFVPDKRNAEKYAALYTLCLFHDAMGLQLDKFYDSTFRNKEEGGGGGSVRELSLILPAHSFRALCYFAADPAFGGLIKGM